MEPDTLYQLLVLCFESHLFRFAGFALLTLAFSLVTFSCKSLFWRSVAQMSLVWALINLLIYIKLTQHMRPEKFANSSLLHEHVAFWMEVNLVLDGIYLLLAFGLFHLARRYPTQTPRLRGFGFAVAVQGLGLLLLDAVFYGQIIFMA